MLIAVAMRRFLLDFAEGSSLVGETLLVRLARSPDSDRADATYMTTLAMSAGRINLVYQAEIIDTICWGGKECAASFKGTKPTSLVRDLNSGEFSHSEDYQPAYDPEQPSLVLPPEEELPDDPGSEPDSVPNLATCAGLEFSEIFPITLIVKPSNLSSFIILRIIKFNCQDVLYVIKIKSIR